MNTFVKKIFTMQTTSMIIKFPHNVSEALTLEKMKINRKRTKSDKITKEQLVIQLCEKGLKK